MSNTTAALVDAIHLLSTLATSADSRGTAWIHHAILHLESAIGMETL